MNSLLLLLLLLLFEFFIVVVFVLVLVVVFLVLVLVLVLVVVVVVVVSMLCFRTVRLWYGIAPRCLASTLCRYSTKDTCATYGKPPP